jgi:glyoxylase-like metal-dependent hydrolase (beta-lactamase superfamily II)
MKITWIKVPIPYPVKWVNCYYINDSTQTLVDTGINTDEGLDAIRSAVEQQGGALEKIQRIIVTHGHGDHIGLAGRITDISGAQVFVHPGDITNVLTAQDRPLEERSERLRSFLEDGGLRQEEADGLLETVIRRYDGAFSPLSGQTMLNSEEVFHFEDFDLEVIHTPGHSPGSVVLFNRTEGILFSGDSLLEEITFNPATETRADNRAPEYRSLASYRWSLELMSTLLTKEVFPGHGSPFSNVEKTITRLRNHHLDRSEKILAILKDWKARKDSAEGATRCQIAKELFPSAVGVELFHRLAAVYVHLVDLEDKGLVNPVKHKEGFTTYVTSG